MSAQLKHTTHTRKPKVDILAKRPFCYAIQPKAIFKKENMNYLLILRNMNEFVSHLLFSLIWDFRGIYKNSLRKWHERICCVTHNIYPPHRTVPYCRARWIVPTSHIIRSRSFGWQKQNNTTRYDTKSCFSHRI